MVWGALLQSTAREVPAPCDAGTAAVLKWQGMARSTGAPTLVEQVLDGFVQSQPHACEEELPVQPRRQPLQNRNTDGVRFEDDT